MALFNIKSQTSSIVSTASWDTGNNRESIVPKPKYLDISQQNKALDPIKFNFYYNNTQNNFSPLPIRSSLIATRTRLGYYQIYFGQTPEPLRITDLYFLPVQNISSVFSYSLSQFNKNQKVKDQSYQLFLPANYQDPFNSKKNILNQIISRLENDKIVYIVENSEIIAYFLQNNPLDNLVYNSSTLGISYTKNKKNLPSIDTIPVVLNLLKDSNIIVSLIYSPSLSNSEVSIKHPLLSSVLSIRLPSQDQNIT